ncbi:hypothetical protein ABKN59_010811 [Abortiporus biennis]
MSHTQVFIVVLLHPFLGSPFYSAPTLSLDVISHAARPIKLQGQISTYSYTLRFIQYISLSSCSPFGTNPPTLDFNSRFSPDSFHSPSPVSPIYAYACEIFFKALPFVFRFYWSFRKAENRMYQDNFS